MSDEQVEFRIRLYSFLMGYGGGFISAVLLFSVIGLTLD